MKIFKYFFQFLRVISLFATFKVIGQRNASFASSYLAKIFGPWFRSKKIIEKNLKICFKEISSEKIKNISQGMWDNIGRTFSEYIFLNNFKKNHNELIKLRGLEYLDEIKKNKKPVVFVSGHFSNFELIGTKIDACEIKFSAMYRPLNNFFLNPIMEYLRLKYVCPVMIKKGRSSVRELLKKIHLGYSIIILVDQRISEGKRIELFNSPALTSTIPAQISLKYNCKIVPLHMERLTHNTFKMTIHKPIEYEKTNKYEEDIYNLTLKINKKIEKIILEKPEQWLWSHNRWK